MIGDQLQKITEVDWLWLIYAPKVHAWYRVRAVRLVAQRNALIRIPGWTSLSLIIDIIEVSKMENIVDAVALLLRQPVR